MKYGSRIRNEICLAPSNTYNFQILEFSCFIFGSTNLSEWRTFRITSWNPQNVQFRFYWASLYRSHLWFENFHHVYCFIHVLMLVCVLYDAKKNVLYLTYNVYTHELRNLISMQNFDADCIHSCWLCIHVNKM